MKIRINNNVIEYFKEEVVTRTYTDNQTRELRTIEEVQEIGVGMTKVCIGVAEQVGLNENNEPIYNYSNGLTAVELRALADELEAQFGTQTVAIGNRNYHVKN